MLANSVNSQTEFYLLKFNQPPQVAVLSLKSIWGCSGGFYWSSLSGTDAASARKHNLSREFYQMSTLSVQMSGPSTTTTCQSVRGGKRRGWVGGWVGVGAVTHPAAQIEGPAAHLLEETEPGARDSCLGSRLLRPCWSLLVLVHDPCGPSPAPRLLLSSSSSASSFHLAPPDYPSLSTPGRRSPLLLSAAPSPSLSVSASALSDTARVDFQAYICVPPPPPPQIRSP